MANKITNFEDYRKKEVSQDTVEIEIEDPFKFLNEEEREEYIRQRQKAEEAEKKPERRQEAPQKRERPEQRPEELERRPERPVRRPEPRREELYEEDDYPDEEYDREYGDEDYDEEASDEGGVNMELVVRIASIITGVVILFFVGMFVKTRVFDRYLAPDPDEAQTTVAALPAGYTEKKCTVVVSGASLLNLRSVPSTESSDSVVAMVPEGDELSQIAVSSDGSWALVEFEGQQCYASTKYLKEK